MYPQNYSLTPLGKILFGTAALCAINEIFSEPNDTIVYYLYRRNKIVYIGITYEDRIETRLNEHERNGLLFDEYDYGYCMSRGKALEKEKKEITRHRPKYNCHHNYKY